jgi:Zn-dependent protease with chaperone function
VFTGALAGAGGAFTAIYTHELLGSPIKVLISVLSGAVLSIVIVAVIAGLEGDLLRLRGYRYLSVSETRRIAPLLQLVGNDRRLPDLPRFAMFDSEVAGAWTHMRHVVISQGLLDTLDDAELSAVIAHELHHWAVGDSVAQHFIWACAWPIVLLYNVASRLSGLQLGVRTHGFQFGRRLIPFIAWMFAWPSWLLVQFAVRPAAANSMRQSEYDADAAALRIGRGPDLIRALEKLTVWERARTGWEATLYHSHPPTALRIDRLEPRHPDDVNYQEPQLGIDRRAAAEWLSAMAVAVVIGLVIVLGVGYAINVYKTHRLSTGPVAVGNADAVVANYTAAFLNGLTDPYQYNAAISQYADPSVVSALQADANAIDQNGSLFGSVDSSEATIVGCRYYSDPSSVDIRVAWTFGMLTSPDRTVWFTTDIPMVFLNDTWKVTTLPTLPSPNDVGLNDPSLPAGFTNC